MALRPSKRRGAPTPTTQERCSAAAPPRLERRSGARSRGGRAVEIPPLESSRPFLWPRPISGLTAQQHEAKSSASAASAASEAT